MARRANLPKYFTGVTAGRIAKKKRHLRQYNTLYIRSAGCRFGQQTAGYERAMLGRRSDMGLVSSKEMRVGVIAQNWDTAPNTWTPTAPLTVLNCAMWLRSPRRARRR